MVLGLLSLVVPALTAAGSESAEAPANRGAALKLNEAGYQHAVDLIGLGKVALDNRGDWGRRRPSAADQDAFIDRNGWAEYADWFLAANDAFGAQTRRHYGFPFGDFAVVRRSALVAAQYRARQWGHADVEAAAQRLLAMIEAKAPG